MFADAFSDGWCVGVNQSATSTVGRQTIQTTAQSDDHRTDRKRCGLNLWVMSMIVVTARHNRRLMNRLVMRTGGRVCIDHSRYRRRD